VHICTSGGVDSWLYLEWEQSVCSATARFLAVRLLLVIPRCRWENNIKMDLKEVGWGAWTGLIWLRIGTGGGLL
jgi:hypothetical protein